MNASHSFKLALAGDRLEALFDVSILEDKGHARNELWDIVYQMSCDLQIFDFYV